jgi:hypothetical protein
MDANVDQIASELAALTQRFVDLGAKLGEAAQALDATGAPPANGLVEALAGARGQFVQLRAQALSAADAAGVPPPPEPQSLNEIEPLLAAIGEALGSRARREAVERAQQAAVTTIDRVLEIIHQDDPAFSTLVACHAGAREARAAILALTELESDDARQVMDRVRAFADLLTMVENREGLDDDRYAELEESVSRGFGRALAVAVARGRIGFEGEFVEPPPAPEPAPQPAVEPSEAPPIEPPPMETEAVTEEVMASVPEATAGEAPPLESEESALPEEPASGSETIAVEEPAPGAEVATDPSAPDETAQWWLAAWARWSGWKSSHDFAAAVREELGKYPYLLSVPIQKSPEYEDGLLAYGYSILMDHVEKQNAGCVGNALNSLKPGQTRPVGEQLYDYLITEGRLRETYADFVKNTLVAAVPEPGVWFQFRILESKEDTRILQRPSARIGDPELSGQRLASDGQRYNEHKFKMTLGPLTTRFVQVSADVKEARGAGFKLVGDGAPSDSGWVVSVSAGKGASGKNEARRISEDGLHIPGLGKEHQALWVAVFNPDTAADRRYELSVFLRKDAKSPFRTKG